MIDIKLKNRANHQADRSPFSINAAVTSKNRPVTSTKVLENPMVSKSKKSFSAVTLSSIAGVRTEIMLMIPSPNIRIAGNTRIKSLSIFNRKLITPASKGSQNSKNRKSRVAAMASTLGTPVWIRIKVMETSMAPNPLRNGEIIRKITTMIYASTAVIRVGVRLRAAIAIYTCAIPTTSITVEYRIV